MRPILLRLLFGKCLRRTLRESTVQIHAARFAIFSRQDLALFAPYVEAIKMTFLQVYRAAQFLVLVSKPSGIKGKSCRQQKAPIANHREDHCARDAANRKGADRTDP